MNRTILAVAAFVLGVASATADEHNDWPRPDAHAPAGIMGDHVHDKGGLMFSYHYMHMHMDGMRNGDSRVSATAVHANFSAVTPVEMDMDMHMLGTMYGATDNLTLMLMGNYQRKEMDHVIAAGAGPLIGFNGGSRTFTAETEGIGDLKLSALYRLPSGDDWRWHLTLGVSLPTGSIGETDAVPGPGGIAQRQLPAPMQLGSGTVDLLPGITYTAFRDHTSWGVQARGTIRTDDNAHGYRYGNKVNVDLWGAWRASDSFSVSVGLAGQWEDKMHGTQTDLLFNLPFGMMPRSVTTAFSDNYGGERLDAALGCNWQFRRGPLAGHRLAAEVRLPVYQDLNGYQLETDLALTFAWSASF